MKINIYQTHEDGSNYYRNILPAVALHNQGVEVALCETPILEPPECDVVVFNRPVSRDYVAAILQMKEDGYAVVIDVDDNIGAVRTQHAMFNRAAEIDGILKWACKEATLVTCTTPALADVYGFGHSVVVPNYVPEWYLNCKQAPHIGPVRLGWSGTIRSHPNDLQVTEGKVSRALDETGNDFTLIGPNEQAEDVRRALKYKRRALVSGWFTFEQYPHAMAQMDIGIVPLENCTFNDSKSALKMAEFAACGAPVLATPTPDNMRLHGLGVGQLCERPMDWYRKSLALLESAELRADLAGRGREAMRSQTIEGQAGEWYSAWAKAWALGCASRSAAVL